jgi:hypothetical protein
MALYNKLMERNDNWDVDPNYYLMFKLVFYVSIFINDKDSLDQGDVFKLK